MGQAVTAEARSDRPHRHLPRSQHHQRLDRLSPAFTRNADDGDLRHRRVLVEAVLDLHGTDVFTPGDDDVLLPVRDDQVTIRFDLTLVTGVEPVIRQGLRRFSGCCQ